MLLYVSLHFLQLLLQAIILFFRGTELVLSISEHIQGNLKLIPGLVLRDLLCIGLLFDATRVGLEVDVGSLEGGIVLAGLRVFLVCDVERLPGLRVTLLFVPVQKSVIFVASPYGYLQSGLEVS